MQRFHVFKFVKPTADGGWMDWVSPTNQGVTIDISTLEMATAFLQSLCTFPASEWGYVVDTHTMSVAYVLNGEAPPQIVTDPLTRYLVFKFDCETCPGGWADLVATVGRESDAIALLKSLCTQQDDWGHLIDTLGAQPVCVFKIGAGPKIGTAEGVIEFR